MSKTVEIFDFESNGRPFRAVFVPAGAGVKWHEKDTVKFYDRTYDFTEHGQFTGGSYYTETILSHQRGVGLVLQGGEPLWTLSAEAMIEVLDALEAWDAEERTYVVGVPLVVTVDKYGSVRMTLDASEVADRHFGEDSDHAETYIDRDREAIDRAIRRHTASLTY